MITYYSIDPEMKAKTKVATFVLRADGTVEVRAEKAHQADQFRYITVMGRDGKGKELTPRDGQRFLDGLFELNTTRTYALVVDE